MINRWNVGLFAVLATLSTAFSENSAEALMEALLPPELRQGKPAYTEEEALAWYQETLPLVEKVLGVSLKETPKIEVNSRSRLEDLLMEDFKLQIKAIKPNTDAFEVDIEAALLASQLTPMMLAKYGVVQRTLLFLPKNFEPLFKLAKIEVPDRRSMMRLVMAHEITHVLQDQELDLRSRLAGVSNPKEATALSSLIEGQALLVQELIAKQLGHEDDHHRLMRLVDKDYNAHGPPPGEDIATMSDSASINSRRCIRQERWRRCGVL